MLQKTNQPAPITAPAISEDPSAGLPMNPEESASIPNGTVPRILDGDQVKNYYIEFCQEYAPVGPTEITLVKELARHAAATDRWTEGSGAVGRQAARHLPNLTNCTGQADLMSVDVVLAGAMTAESTVRCEKHCLLRSRAFLQTLQKLEDVQSVRRERERRQAAIPPLEFADETACEQYLVDRLRSGWWACP